MCRGERWAIKRSRFAGIAAGTAGLCLAVGAVALGVTSGGDVMGNWIGAGHLQILVNGSAAPVGLGVGDLLPGERQQVDEIVSADMAGVPAAQLNLTVTPPPSVAAGQTLQVLLSDVLPQSDLHWDGSACAPATGFPHTADLGAATSATGAALGTIVPGSGVCVRFVLGLSGAAGNAQQGRSVSYAIAYHLQQSGPGPLQTNGSAP